VIAICLALLLKVALLGEMDGLRLLPALVLAPVFGRWAMVFLIQLYPSAHTSTIGQLVKQYSGWLEFTVATATALLAGILFFRLWGVALLLLLAAVLWPLGRFLTNRLGGLTGDNYGAVCELCEVFVLLFISLSTVLEGIL
jgi:adenosylcobinamide-GDP ribazoletransferase